VSRRRLLLLAALAVLFAAALVIFLATFWIVRQRPRRAAGPLPQEAYVWQRTWGPEVRAALGRTTDLSGLVILAAEVDLSTKPPRVTRAAYDPAALRRPVGLAVRIGRFGRRAEAAGRFEDDPELTRQLAALARRLVDEARSRGLEVAEFQLDYDCPESRLDDYPVLVRAVREALSPVPVTITALPAWLRHRGEMKTLLHETDGWVLQVHSLEPPSRPDAPIELCDPEAARRAVEDAARFRVPFRVALPTYSYLIAFAPTGKLLGVSAEGPLPSWPPGVQVRMATSDPAEIAGLVSGWTADRPAELSALIWYRLPVAGDRLNWSWPAFRAVQAGRPPRRDLRAVPRSAEPGLVEIDLSNAGEADEGWPFRIELEWGSGTLLASDGLSGYRILRTGPRVLFLERQISPWDPPLLPGARRTVAWLRFNEETRVSASVAP
jgi:hypothetical protein